MNIYCLEMAAKCIYIVNFFLGTEGVRYGEVQLYFILFYVIFCIMLGSHEIYPYGQWVYPGYTVYKYNTITLNRANETEGHVDKLYCKTTHTY